MTQWRRDFLCVFGGACGGGGGGRRVEGQERREESGGRREERGVTVEGGKGVPVELRVSR